MNKYVGFEDLADLKKNFDSDCDNITDDEILFASYGQGSYNGDVFILVERNGKLYTVEGSHCSCYGLEGLWHMIETDKQVLRKREFYRERNYTEDHPELMMWLKEFIG